jgi:hypothetical protein
MSIPPVLHLSIILLALSMHDAFRNPSHTLYQSLWKDFLTFHLIPGNSICKPSISSTEAEISQYLPDSAGILQIKEHMKSRIQYGLYR